MIDKSCDEIKFNLYFTLTLIRMKTILNSLAIALGLSCIAIAPTSAETISQSHTFGVAAPACAEQNQQALNRCAFNWSKTAEFLRSLIYADIYSQLNEPRQAQLKVIEQNWNSYRDTHCHELSEPFRGGSIYPLIYQSCRARVTNDRIADLQGKSFSQLTTDTTTQRLNMLLNQEKMKNSSGQRQWQSYETLHCQFESVRFPEQPHNVKQCRDRLAESRLRELEFMVRDR